MSSLNSALAMDSSCLEAHQYSEWRHWATSPRLSSQDLMEDSVDDAAERHMYIPMKQAAIPTSQDLDNDEMVARVVAFFQNIHANSTIRQLQLAEGHHDQPYATASPPQQHYEQQHGCRCHTYMGDDSFTSNTSAIDAASLTELGLTPSLIAEQEVLWNRAKQQRQQETPIIPDWLHHAAQQEGRKIRVVTVQQGTETRTVTCIGCHKKMLAASNVEIVFCPECGTTFAPDMLAGE